MELTQAYLKECLSYDSETGIFTWKERPIQHFPSLKVWKIWNKNYANKLAGGVNNIGYHVIGVNNSRYLAHRLAYLYVYGCFPDLTVDHINHIRTDNRLCNLRQVSQKDNCRNTSMGTLNTSGFVGVYWDKQTSKWRVKIKVEGKTIHIGRFLTKEEAIKARCKAMEKYSFHENHGECKND